MAPHGLGNAYDIDRGPDVMRPNHRGTVQHGNRCGGQRAVQAICRIWLLREPANERLARGADKKRPPQLGEFGQVTQYGAVEGVPGNLCLTKKTDARIKDDLVQIKTSAASPRQ